jgi:hypothetical protein
VCDAVSEFAGDKSSLVYARGPGTAERWANQYTKTLSDVDEVSADTMDLIKYLKDSIHPRYSLIPCLKRGVAYHHGRLPDFVREEIEELFGQKDIHILFCTSTLLAGVNLPANKIFVVSPKKASEKLTPFEFKNLTGRAGRLGKHLCGIVYCVCIPNSENTNQFESYRGEVRKTVVPTVDNRLSESFDRIHQIVADSAPSLLAEDKRLASTVTLLRSRFLRGPEHARRYLATRRLSESRQASLLSELAKSLGLLTIPPDLVLKNPYVDPVLQEQLYVKVKADPSDWIIRRQQGFAKDLDRVFDLLDDIFEIVAETGNHGIPEYHRNYMITFAKLWLRGRPFRQIVTRALPSDLRKVREVPTSEVDRAIRRAMGLINKDVSFVMAKYFSVLAEVVADVVPLEEQEDYSMTLGLPAMLELGCSDPQTLALISACIPRGAAIKISEYIPIDVEDPVMWLSLNQNSRKLSKLPRIYHKILKRNGIWQ